MFGRRRRVDEAELEGLRRLYSVLGMGFPAEALRIFGGEPAAEAADQGSGEGQVAEGRWCLRHLGRTIRCLRAPDLSNRELFALPAGWEVIRVVVKGLVGRRGRRGDRITVFGEMYCRPRGTWENIGIPFQHMWTMCAGRALLFENVVDATILTPEGRLAACGV